VLAAERKKKNFLIWLPRPKSFSAWLKLEYLCEWYLQHWSAHQGAPRIPGRGLVGPATATHVQTRFLTISSADKNLIRQSKPHRH